MRLPPDGRLHSESAGHRCSMRRRAVLRALWPTPCRMPLPIAGSVCGVSLSLGITDLQLWSSWSRYSLPEMLARKLVWSIGSGAHESEIAAVLALMFGVSRLSGLCGCMGTNDGRGKRVETRRSPRLLNNPENRRAILLHEPQAHARHLQQLPGRLGSLGSNGLERPVRQNPERREAFLFRFA